MDTLSPRTSENDFKNLYGRRKPNQKSPVIFSCKSGKRALTAYNTAESLGYVNIKCYRGSWIDWAKQEGLPS